MVAPPESRARLHSGRDGRNGRSRRRDESSGIRDETCPGVCRATAGGLSPGPPGAAILRLAEQCRATAIARRRRRADRGRSAPVVRKRLVRPRRRGRRRWCPGARRMRGCRTWTDPGAVEDVETSDGRGRVGRRCASHHRRKFVVFALGRANSTGLVTKIGQSGVQIGFAASRIAFARGPAHVASGWRRASARLIGRA